MSVKVQATCPHEAGLVITASRAELKIGTTLCAHHVPHTPDMVAAVFRAIFEGGKDND